MTMVITDIDVRSVELEGGKFSDEGLLFAAADTFVKGTILARKLVNDTVSVTPNGGNTGTKALSVTTAAGRTLKIGNYSLVAGTLSSGLGPWTLTDPDGIAQTVTTAGGAADDDLVFSDHGLTVVVAASGTNFVTGDSAAIVPAAIAGEPLVPFDPVGTNGEQKPAAVLTYEASLTAGGTKSIRALVAGEVNANMLVIDAGGTVTKAILDQLRDVGIVATSVQQLAEYDNS